MKFEINVGQFRTLLKPILGNSNYGKDILQVTADDDGLKFKVEQGDVTVLLIMNNKNNEVLQYNCIEKGCGAVNIHDLAVFLKPIPADTKVLIAFPTHLTLTAIPASEKIEIGPSIEYAVTANELPTCKFKQFNVQRKPFINALKAIRFAIGHEYTKPYYHGIFIIVSKGKLCCFAGNGSLFAVKYVKINRIKTESSKKLFLPTRSVNSIISSFDAASSKNISVSVGGDLKTCLLKSGDLELAVENIIRPDFAEIDNVLSYRFPHRLCFNIKDLKQPIALITGAAKIDKTFFQQPVDIDIINGTGEMLLRYGSATQSVVSLNISSVIPDTKDKPLRLSCSSFPLAAICDNWPDQTLIEIHCEINSIRPILAEPKYKENILSNRPDVILFAALPLPEDSATDEVKTENIGHAKAMEEMKDGQINR